MNVRLSNRVYDIMKDLQIIVPALGVLYVALAGAWGLPYADQIAKTATAVTTFIGAIVKISCISYYRDQVTEAETDGEKG